MSGFEMSGDALLELEGLRDWVSSDIASAAMQSVREKRSLDAFIADLQAEVNLVAADVNATYDIVEAHLEEQAAALASATVRH